MKRVKSLMWRDGRSLTAGADGLRKRFFLGAVGVLVAVIFGFASTTTARADFSVANHVHVEACPGPVTEGESFRIVLSSQQSGVIGPDVMPIDGYWYTHADTADGSDYEYLYAAHQRANESERRAGLMGRDFNTLNDHYSEVLEQFEVYFDNTSDTGDDASCTVTIIDDDGVGAVDVRVISRPADGEAYRVGEDILIEMGFSQPVYIDGDVRLSIRVGDGDSNWRGASFAWYNGYGVVFAYRVQPGDMDFDGIAVDNGGFAGSSRYGFVGGGSLRAVKGGYVINQWYRGVGDQAGHRVDGNRM